MLSVLPDQMRSEFNGFPDRMNKLNEVVQDKVSKVHYDRAIALIDPIERETYNYGGSYTSRIRKLSDTLEKAAHESESILTPRWRLAFFERVKASREKLTALEIARRSAYQKWALERVNGFMKDWNGVRVGTNKRAKRFFYNNDICKVDETLVVPEVGRILSRVMTCVTGELGSDEGSQIEYDMANGTKKRLEDF